MTFNDILQDTVAVALVAATLLIAVSIFERVGLLPAVISF